MYSVLFLAPWGLRGAALGSGSGWRLTPRAQALRSELSGLYTYADNVFLEPFLSEEQWLAIAWPALQRQEVPQLPAQDRQALVREALLLGHLGYLEALVEGGHLLRTELRLEELWLAFARPLALTQGRGWSWRKTEALRAYVDRVVRLKISPEEEGQAQGSAEVLAQVAQALFPFLLFMAWAAQTQQGLPLGRGPAPCFLARGQVAQWARLLRAIGVPDTEATPLSLGLSGPLAPSAYMADFIAELVEEEQARATYLEGVFRLALPKRLGTLLDDLLERCQVDRLSVAYPAQLQAMVQEQYAGIALPPELGRLIFDYVGPLMLPEGVFDALPVYAPLYHTLRGYGACPLPPPSGSSWRVWGTYAWEELRFQVGAFMGSTSWLDRWCGQRLCPLLPSFMTQEELRDDLSVGTQRLLVAAASLSWIGNPCFTLGLFFVGPPAWLLYGLTFFFEAREEVREIAVLRLALLSAPFLVMSFLFLDASKSKRWLREGMRMSLPLIHSANRLLTSYPFYYLWGHEDVGRGQPFSASLKHTLVFLPCHLFLCLLNFGLLFWLIGLDTRILP